MYVLRVHDLPPDLQQNLLEMLAERGSVGVVRGEEATSLTLPDGTTVTTTDAPDLETLDLLAPRCDYAVLVGGPLEYGAELNESGGMVRGSLLDEPVALDRVDGKAIVDRVEETEPYVTLASLVERIKDHPKAERAGAIATFTGRVRAKDDPDDTPTEHLEFERYGPVAREKMDRIRSDLLAREGVHEVLMHHRTGVLPAGRDIVFVVVLAGHRDEAFETVEEGINRLKAEVPIFKKEVTIDEEFWVHNRP